MTEKTLGQVAFEAAYKNVWLDALPVYGDSGCATDVWVRAAAAVAAIVREQCAQECADYAAEARSIGAHVEAAVAEHLEEAIRSMIS